MDFLGISKKEHVEFLQGFIKTKQISKGDQEKIMWNFQGSSFFLGISKGSNTILWNFQRWSFVLSGISVSKVKE